MFKRKFVAITLCFSCLLGVAITTTSVSALKERNGEALLKKALLDGMTLCYKNSDYVKPSPQLIDFTNNSHGFTAAAILNYSNDLFGTDATSDGAIWIPTNVSNNITDSELSCEQVFTGYSSRSQYVRGLNGFFDTSHMTTPESWGYKATTTAVPGEIDASTMELSFTVVGSQGNLAAADMIYDGDGDGNPDQLICAGKYAEKKSGKPNAYRVWNLTGCSGQLYIAYKKHNQDLFFKLAVDKNLQAEFLFQGDTGGASNDSMWYTARFGDTFKCPDSKINSCTLAEAIEANFGDSGVLTTSFMDSVVQDINNIFSNANDGYWPTTSHRLVSSETASNPVTTYDFISGASTAAGVAAANMTGQVNGGFSGSGVSADTYSSPWTDAEVYSLYYMYLENVTKDPSSGIYVDPGNCSEEKPSSVDFQYAYKNASNQWCGITLGTGSGQFLNDNNGGNGWAVFNTSGLKHLGPGTFEDVLAWFSNDDNYRNLKEEDYAEATIKDDGTIDGDVETDPTQVGETRDVTCYNSTSLGWIICPALDIVNKTIDGLYGVVEKQLTLETGLIGSSEGGGSGTYEGWKVFQNFANITVILLLLVVIFSQATGVGIDNYGIKKTLPKLIIAAVLVNLSFVVCQLCADLSNIAGVNLNSMFETFASSVTTDKSVPAFTNIVSSILTGAGLYGTYFVAAATVAMWLPAVFLAAIGLLISILFFFVLLAVRKALLIVFIVIAPLALACYMLPNTKKWFDKWVKGFGAMLLVYPICGLAMGVGTWMSKLLMKSAHGADGGNFIFDIVAALMNVIPFFFIPTLLKNGLSAIGSIGAKVAGFGDRVSSGVKRGINDSEGFKDAQRRLGMRQNLRTVNRLQAKLDKNGKLSGFDKRRMNNARLAYNKEAKADMDAEAGGVLLTPGSTGYEAYLKAQESAQSKQNLDNEVARIGEETNNYDTDTMNRQLQAIMNRSAKGKLSPEEELHMRALMYKMAQGSGYSKKALAKTVANGSSMDAVAAASKFMSKNADVASAINGKDLGAGQYLREVNNGTATTSYAAWQTATRVVDGQTMTNQQFVLNKVITDNADFMGQSSSVVAAELGMKEVIGTDGSVSYVRDTSADMSNTVSNSRIEDMLKSERILESADRDVRAAILAAAQDRGIAIPPKWGGPAPSGGKKGRRKRGPMGAGSSGSSGSFH